MIDYPTETATKPQPGDAIVSYYDDPDGKTVYCVFPVPADGEANPAASLDVAYASSRGLARAWALAILSLKAGCGSAWFLLRGSFRSADNWMAELE